MKRKRICNAVLEMISSGMSEAEITVSAVARKAGVGKGTVYGYFESKTEMFLQTAGYFAEEALEAFGACYKGENFRNEFRNLLCEADAYIRRCRSLFFFLFFSGNPVSSPSLDSCPLEEVFPDLQNVLKQYFRDFISLGQKEHLLREKISEGDMLLAYSAVLSMLVMSQDPSFPKEFSSKEDLLENVLEAFCRILQ